MIEGTLRRQVVQFSPSVPDPLVALRQATSAQHQRLDQSLSLARPGANLHHYAQHLFAVHGWLQTLGPWLDRMALVSVPRLRRIELDLIDCEMPRLVVAHAAQGHSVRVCGNGSLARSASDGSAAFCWGIGYVVEGSALGGQVLHRRLRLALAPHPLRYLAGEGALAGSRWKEFLAALRAQVRTPAQAHDACAGAVAAFDAFALSVRWSEGIA